MKKILLLIPLILQLVFVGPSQAFFEQGYMTVQDIIHALYLKFGKVVLQSDYSCQILSEGNRKSLGDANPMTGEVPVSLPDSSFLTWIQDCINNYHSAAHSEYSFNGLPDAQKIRANELLNVLYEPLLVKFAEYKKLHPQATLRSAVTTWTFDQLSVQEKELYIKNLLYWSLGSDEEILSYGLIANMDGFRADLLNYASAYQYHPLSEVTRMLTQVLLKRDEFLLY